MFLFQVQLIRVGSGSGSAYFFRIRQTDANPTGSRSGSATLWQITVNKVYKPLRNFFAFKKEIYAPSRSAKIVISAVENHNNKERKEETVPWSGRTRVLNENVRGEESVSSLPASILSCPSHFGAQHELSFKDLSVCKPVSSVHPPRVQLTGYSGTLTLLLAVELLVVVVPLVETILFK